jgi:hypothetical protein
MFSIVRICSQLVFVVALKPQLAESNSALHSFPTPLLRRTLCRTRSRADACANAADDDYKVKVDLNSKNVSVAGPHIEHDFASPGTHVFTLLMQVC